MVIDPSSSDRNEDDELSGGPMMLFSKMIRTERSEKQYLETSAAHVEIQQKSFWASCVQHTKKKRYLFA